MKKKNKIDELQTTLDSVKFLEKVRASERPLKTSFKVSADIYGIFIAKFNKFLESEIDALLGKAAPDPMSEVFSEEDILILKAVIMKHRNNPKVIQMLGLDSVISEEVSSASPKKPKTKKPKGKIKIIKTPVNFGDEKGGVGRHGKVMSPEDVQGVSGGQEINFGDEFVVEKKHSVSGFWQAALTRDPTIKFLVHDTTPEWGE